MIYRETHSFDNPWTELPLQAKLNRYFNYFTIPMRCNAHNITRCQRCTNKALPTEQLQTGQL